MSRNVNPQNEDESKIPAEIWEKFKRSKIWKEMKEVLEVRLNQDLRHLRICREHPLVDADGHVAVRERAALQAAITEEEFFLSLPDVMIETLQDGAASREREEEEG